MSRKTESLKNTAAIMLFLLVLLAAAAWAAWALMASVSPDVARAWALLATAALPLALWLGYWLGLTESRGRMRGIGEGLREVVNAAAAIDLRGQARVSGRAKETPVVDLPPVEFVERRQLSSGEEVDL